MNMLWLLILLPLPNVIPMVYFFYRSAREDCILDIHRKIKDYLTIIYSKFILYVFSVDDGLKIVNLFHIIVESFLYFCLYVFIMCSSNIHKNDSCRISMHLLR